MDSLITNTKSCSLGFPSGFDSWDEKNKNIYLKAYAELTSKSQLDDANRTINRLTNRFKIYKENTSKQLESTANTINTFLNNAQSTLSDRENKIEILQKDIKILEAQTNVDIPFTGSESIGKDLSRNESTQELTEIQAKLQSEKLKSSNLNQQCELLIRNNAVIKKNIIQLETKAKVLEEQNSNILHEQGKTKELISTLETELRNEIEKNKERQISNESLLGQITKLQTECAQNEKLINDSTTELETCKNELEQAKKERDGEKIVSEKFERDYEELKKDYDEAMNDKNNLKSLNKQLIEETRSIGTDKIEMKKMNAEFIQKNDSLLEEYSGMRNQIESIEQKFKIFFRNIFQEVLVNMTASFLNVKTSAEIIPIVINGFNLFLEKEEQISSGFKFMDQLKKSQLVATDVAFKDGPPNSKYPKLFKAEPLDSTKDSYTHIGALRELIFAMRNTHARLFIDKPTPDKKQTEEEVPENPPSLQNLKQDQDMYIPNELDNNLNEFVKNELLLPDTKIGFNDYKKNINNENALTLRIKHEFTNLKTKNESMHAEVDFDFNHLKKNIKLENDLNVGIKKEMHLSIERKSKTSLKSEYLKEAINSKSGEEQTRPLSFSSDLDQNFKTDEYSSDSDSNDDEEELDDDDDDDWIQDANNVMEDLAPETSRQLYESNLAKVGSDSKDHQRKQETNNGFSVNFEDSTIDEDEEMDDLPDI